MFDMKNIYDAIDNFIYKDFLTLHIRSAGNWTNKLNEYFQNEIQKYQGGINERKTISQR